MGNLIPGQVWDYVGNRASKKSRARSGEYRVRNEEQLALMIRSHAEKVYFEKPFDLIISGHMHVFDDHVINIDGKKVRSVNLGSWFEKEVKVFSIIDGNPQWQVIG
ncbi:hypothetical protein D3C87_1492560 [compost metagenome]